MTYNSIIEILAHLNHLGAIILAHLFSLLLLLVHYTVHILKAGFLAFPFLELNRRLEPGHSPLLTHKSPL